jgi:hypothetical protein
MIFLLNWAINNTKIFYSKILCGCLIVMREENIRIKEESREFQMK